MNLRDYQHNCKLAVVEQFKDSNSTLVVMPTGTGKTILFADVIRCFFPRRALVVAHRQELIWQARDKIQAATGLATEVEMGDHKAQTGGGLFRCAHVTIATVQTLTAGGDGGGRIGKFDPFDYGLIVCDEAHHFVSPSFRRVIEYFRTNPKLKVLGVTATPDRADEEALGQVFETVAFDYEILDAIKDGWLVPVDQQMVSVDDLDFSTVRTTAGDLNGADLAAIMETEKNLHAVASPTLDIIGDRRTLVFTASVRHAEQLAEIFKRHGKQAAWVCGKTDKDERNAINEKFHKGDIQILANCGTHTEGFDSPGIEVVVMARPTKSRSLYAQMVGRSTRPLPGIVDEVTTPEARREAIAASPKPSCLVVDFVGNSGKHKLVSSADILGGKLSEEAVAAAASRAARTGKPMRVDQALEEEEEAERERRRIEDEARRAKLTATAKYKKTAVDPFALLNIAPEKERAWDKNKALSERQRNMLRRSGLDPDAMTFTQAKQIIGELIHRWDNKLCTIGQAKILKRYGYDTNIAFEHASKVIDAIAKNGWKRPATPIAPPTRPVPAAKVDDDNVPF